MELNVIGASPMEVSDQVFAAEFKEALIHQVVTAYQATGRSGTKAQKTRSQVHGTTKKSKKQKGGGARHGALTAPIFVGGGITFAASPRSFRKKINRKMYRGALRSIFSELMRQERLKVVDKLEINEGKTRLLLEKLGELEATGRVIVIVGDVDEKIYLAARNIPNVVVIDKAGVNPVDLVQADNVILTTDSVKKVEEWLA